MPIQGYKGSFSIGGQALGIKKMSVEVSINRLDVTSTASTENADGTISEKAIQGKKRHKITVEADFDADGSGDPPEIAEGGALTISAVAGDTIAGSFLVDSYTNSLDVDGLITYNLTLTSTGVVTRTHPA